MVEPDSESKVGLAGLRRLAIHARDMLAQYPPKPDLYGKDFNGPQAHALVAYTLATHVLTLLVDVIAETAVPLDQVEQERQEAAAKLKDANEFADQQRAIAESARERAVEEESNTQVWMDDYTNLSGAVGDLLGVPEHEVGELEVDELVERIRNLAQPSQEPESVPGGAQDDSGES